MDIRAKAEIIVGIAANYQVKRSRYIFVRNMNDVNIAGAKNNFSN